MNLYNISKCWYEIIKKRILCGHYYFFKKSFLAPKIKLMKKIVLFLFLFISLYVNGQNIPPAIEWQNTIGGTMSDFLYSIQQTTDGGYIMGGRSVSDSSGDKTENSRGTADYWVLKTDASGNITNQRTIGGIATDKLYKVRQTADGGYILGGESDSDISGEKTENCMGGLDIWIIKLDSSLNIQWQNTFGGSSTDYFHSIEQTSDGNYIVSAFSSSPQSSDKHEDSIGGLDYWVIRLDEVGNIIWENTIGSSGDEYHTDINPTRDGGYIVGGRSDGSISGDKTENTNGDFDYWILKLDSSGVIEWQNSIGGINTEDLYAVFQTYDGGYVLGGQSRSGISGDKTESGHGSSDFWIVKTDSLGNPQWQNTVGGNDEEGLISLIQTTDSGFVMGGFSSSPISGDKTEHSNYRDFFIVKVDKNGVDEWQNTIWGNSEDWIQELQQTDDGYILGGYSGSNISGDKTEDCIGWFDYWIVKLTDTYNSISGKLFVDLNNNGVYDSGDHIISNRRLSETQTGRTTYCDQFGNYLLQVLNAGNFSVVPPTLNYYAPVPSVRNVTFANVHLTDTANDFAYQPAGVFNDLCITITPIQNFRPGFDASYIISYENLGTTTISPTIIFYPDSGLTFISSSISASSVSSDSVIWNLGAITPFQTLNITVTVNVDQSLPLGTVLNSGAVIEPVSGDANPSCNTSYVEAVVRGSFDPNQVIVDQHIVSVWDLVNPPYLEYTIYFQNTGTDTAFTVTILDSVDAAKLDLSTLEFIASSDPTNMRYKDWENNLEFKFQNILLPDSGINEPESHGFVKFRIKPKITLVVGDTILNSAAIYFDFNRPVHTNTEITSVILPVMIDMVDTKNTLTLFPNPVGSELSIVIHSSMHKIQLRVVNIMGEIVYSETISNNSESDLIKIDLSSLPEGVYILEADDSKGISHKKFVKKKFD